MHEMVSHVVSASSGQNRRPRIALITDSLVTVGGAEQVFLYMVEEFVEADIFALAYRQNKTLPEFRPFHIRTSWINRLIANHKIFKLLFPLATFVMRHWDLDDYDVVVISSATTAKYLKKGRSRHICYCYFPTRALWNTDSYFTNDSSGFIARIFHAVCPILQRNELSAVKDIDNFIAISNTTREAIAKIYGRESDVLFSPIPVERFRAGMAETKEDFFLLVSRLEEWKRVDYAIEAFNDLGLPLRIIGVGDQEGHLKAMAGPNITFLGRQSMDELVRQYGRARAVIFTPALEYGLVPIEAAAAGTPVIALGYGGVLETMVGLDEAAKAGTSPTAVFFYEQTADSLKEAVRRFEAVTFCRDTLSAYADAFGVPAFKSKLRQMVENYCR